MIVSTRHLVGLPVITKSGLALGRVIDAEIDVESHHIVRYRVRSNSLFERFSSRYDFLIAAAQVIAITQEHLIVEDTFVRQKDISNVPVVDTGGFRPTQASEVAPQL